MLIKAIQELKAEIDELKAPVARGIPAAVLHNVKNIEIRHAPLFQSVVAD